MANVREVFKCEACGNIIEVLHEGAGELVCCGQPMVLLSENMWMLPWKNTFRLLRKLRTVLP